MHPVDIILLFSAGTAMGWSAAIYVEDNPRLIAAYVILCPVAAFVSGYLSLAWLPDYGKVGMIFAALFGALCMRLAISRAGRKGRLLANR